MNETTDNVLIEALDLLEQGVGIDEIVARFPSNAADLRPFLMTAAALSNLATQPALSAEAGSKRAFLAEADRMAADASRPVRAAGNGLWRLLAPMLAVVAVIFLAGAGLASASSSAAPGDVLYGTKRFIEQTRLNLTGDPERAAELREQFRLERVAEIEQLLAAGRVAGVSLTGAVESMDGNRWVVAGVPVVLAADAIIDGRPSAGALVQVDGETRDGVVAAERVTVLVSQMPTLIDEEPLPDNESLPDDSPSDNESSDDPPSDNESPVETASPGPTPWPTTDANDNQNENDPGLPPPGGQPVVPATATPAPPPPTPLPPPPPPATEQPPTAPPPTAPPDNDNDNSGGGGGGDDNDNSGGGGNDNDSGSDNDNRGGGDNDNENDDDSDNDNN